MGELNEMINNTVKKQLYILMFIILILYIVISITVNTELAFIICLIFGTSGMNYLIIIENHRILQKLIYKNEFRRRNK